MMQTKDDQAVIEALAGGELTLAELCVASGLNFVAASYAAGRLQRAGRLRVRDRVQGVCTSGRVYELVGQAREEAAG